MSEAAVEYPVNPDRIIPTLSLSEYFNNHAAFVNKLMAAFKEYGFVAIKNHGVTDQAINDNYAQSKKFFALPEAEKMKYALPKRLRGYGPFGEEGAKDNANGDLKEYWHYGRDLPVNDPGADRYRAGMDTNPEVPEVPRLQPAARRLYKELERAANVLLCAIALGLDLEEHYFEPRTKYGTSLLRTLHYPPTAELDPNTEAVRAGAHEDINLITLLVGSDEPGGEPGLQVLANDGKGGKEWVPMPTETGTIVVNIGDMLARLTNGVLPSTTHRVINPTGPSRDFARYSAPFFLHYNSDELITALESCVSADNPAKPPIRAFDFLMMRLVEIGIMPLKELPRRLRSHVSKSGASQPKKAAPR